MEKPFGVPPEFDDYFKVMTDMLIVAFKADLPRVATFMIGREGSTRAYPEIGVADGHHPLTHHMGNMDMLEKVRQINVLHATAMAASMSAAVSTSCTVACSELICTVEPVTSIMFDEAPSSSLELNVVI